MTDPLEVFAQASDALRGQLCGEGELAGEVDDARATVAELVRAAVAVRKWADPYSLPGCDQNEADIEAFNAALIPFGVQP